MENVNTNQNNLGNGGSNTVKIYTTPTCGYCRMAKDFFHEQNIQYEEYNVAVDAAKRQEMFDKTRQMGVPVIKIGDKYIIGFDKRRIEESLGTQ